MQAFIDIVRYPYEEPYHLRLVVTASNGSHQGRLEIYCNADDLSNFAGALREIPVLKTEAVWELGSELPQDRFAFYFRMRAHLVSGTGHCVLEVRMNNNGFNHRREISEFSIPALPADLDRLAELLEVFSRMEHRQLKWLVTTGELVK